MVTVGATVSGPLGVGVAVGVAVGDGIGVDVGVGVGDVVSVEVGVGEEVLEETEKKGELTSVCFSGATLRSSNPMFG